MHKEPDELRPERPRRPGRKKKSWRVVTAWAYVYIYIIIYIYTWKTIKTKLSVRRGLDIFLSVAFFSKYGHVRLQTLYLQVNSFPEILDSSDWFRQYEYLVYRQYLGQYVDICLLFFFQHNVGKILDFMGTCKFGGKYGSICGQIWVPDHDSKFAPLQAEIPLLETVGGCPNPLLSKDLKNPSQSKTKIRN